MDYTSNIDHEIEFKLIFDQLLIIGTFTGAYNFKLFCLQRIFTDFDYDAYIGLYIIKYEIY